MNIKIRNEADITIVDLDDEIDVSKAPELRQALAELFENTDVKSAIKQLVRTCGLRNYLIDYKKQANNERIGSAGAPTNCGSSTGR